ncbi:hypothetical protein BH09SUM1_BH09SUM1_10620 [soil metagenome]
MAEISTTQAIATNDVEQLLGAAPGLAIIGYSEEGRVVTAGPGAEKLFGYRPEKLIGMTFSALHGQAPTAPLFHPETAGQIESRVTRRRGESLPVQVTFSCATGGEAAWLALYRDQSQLDRSLRELDKLKNDVNGKRSHSDKEAEFLHEILVYMMDTTQTGVAAQDIASGVIAHVNDGFEAITGLKKADVEGASFDEVFAKFPDTKTAFVDYIRRIKCHGRSGCTAPEKITRELDFVSGHRNVEMYGRTIAVEGHNREYALLIIEDNTERQRLQMQLVQSEKLAAVGQLAAGIAHEIRNPLNTIYNAIFDLSEVITNPSLEVAEDIDISIEEIKRVQAIINNLLDFARESERSSGRSDLNEVLQQTIRLVDHDLSNKNIEIKWDLGEIPEVAMSSNAIKQILINLITNAAQAMARGGVLSIRTGTRKGMVPMHSITLSTEIPAGGENTGSIRIAQPGAGAREVYEDHVALEITDSGPGITRDVLSNIFNPFFTTKPPGSGTGLGLSVVHSLVQDAGGAISVGTKLGIGTTFTIELPAVEEEA